MNHLESEPPKSFYALLPLSDVTRIANVTRSTLNEWIESGQLKTVRMPGSSRRRVRRGTLKAFLEQSAMANLQSNDSRG